jgi:hypothetical protein
MDFLGFTLSVWAAIAAGVFFLAMVLACTTDRYGNEGPKWFVLIAGIAVFGFMYWGDISWKYFLSAPFWKGVGIYLGIGIAYSLLEFWIGIRKAVRYWGREWNSFKENEEARIRNATSNQASNASKHRRQYEEEDTSTLEQRFVKSASGRGSRNALVDVKLDDQKKVVPVVNRGELSESIACWTIFWPAYAVSLLLGDLFYELCKKFADIVAALSGRVVRRAFSGTFTP